MSIKRIIKEEVDEFDWVKDVNPILPISKKEISLIDEVINFLIDNEQYGDDWGEHIDTLQKIIDQGPK